MVPARLYDGVRGSLLYRGLLSGIFIAPVRARVCVVRRWAIGIDVGEATVERAAAAHVVQSAAHYVAHVVVQCGPGVPCDRCLERACHQSQPGSQALVNIDECVAPSSDCAAVSCGPAASVVNDYFIVRDMAPGLSRDTYRCPRCSSPAEVPLTRTR